MTINTVIHMLHCLDTFLIYFQFATPLTQIYEQYIYTYRNAFKNKKVSPKGKWKVNFGENITLQE